VRWKILWILLLFPGLLLAGCAGSTQRKQTSSNVHYTLGLSYLSEKDPTGALREFLQAARDEPDNADIQAALAQAYQLKKAYPKAEQHYLKALALKPGDPEVENNLGSLYLDMQRWDDAIRYFRQAADNLLFSHPEVALTGLGVAYHQKGSDLESVHAFKEALEQAPQYLPARLHLGETYYAIGKPGLAVDQYQMVLAVAPKAAVAHFQLGLAYVKLKKKEKAIAAFKEVLNLAPDEDIGQSARDYLRMLQ
jgi:type IV pilus biogenesis/stability protein PilW